MALILICAIIASVILRGWAFTILWDWFIVPVFHVDPITIPYAIGFAIIVGMFTQDIKRINAEDTNELLSRLVLTPFITLGFAWVVKCFI